MEKWGDVKYRRSWELEARAKKFVDALGLVHVKKDRIRCVRSVGTRAKYTVARVHAFPKVWQTALGFEPHYVIEFLSENFDKLSQREQDEILLHELAHIPKTFGGGLTAHNKHFKKRISELLKANDENKK